MSTQDKEAQMFINQWGEGVARVYLLHAADSRLEGYDVIAKLGERMITRLVRHPADVWVRIGPDGQFGQRWHPTSKSGSKSVNPKSLQRGLSDGEWKDVTEKDLATIKDELEFAFWNQATQELQPDGTWVSVKPALR